MNNLRYSRWSVEQVGALRQDGRRIVLAILAVLAVSGVLLPFREQLGVLNVMLLFLLLAFVLGLWLGLRPAIGGAVLSFLSFDFLFLRPYLTLTVANADHVLALFVYLAAAIVSSVLIARLREQARALAREARRTSLLYDLNRALVQEPTLGALLQTITRSVVDIYGAKSCRMVTVAPGGELAVRARWPESLPETLDRDGLTMARWVVETRRPAGLGAQRRIIRDGDRHGAAARSGTTRARRPGDVLYLPVMTPEGVRGVLEVSGRPGGGQFHQEDEALLGSFADQAALALERARLVEEATHTAVLEQSNEVKTSLIAAVSHDLRTPLTAIKASASAMLNPSVTWTEEGRTELLRTINDETDRLTAMVSNLLDLSRIESGALRPDKDWHSVDDLLADSVTRSNGLLEGREVQVEIEPDLPLVPMDWAYMSQVMANLLSNAVKYSPAGSPVVVSARVVRGELEIRVHNEGAGILPDRLPHIFDRFYRAQEGSGISGSGIGLSICKGLVEAQGGVILVESQPGRGATFIVRLPLEGERA